MHPVAYIELISVLICLAGGVFVIVGWKRPGFLRAIPVLLLILLLLMIFYGFALFWEWSGIGQRFRWHFIEDFAGVFIPVLWAFVFYAIVKSGVEGDLRESREHFRNLVESSSDWIWEVDMEGRYTYASPNVLEILGYTPEEIIGKTPFDLMPPEEAKRVSTIFLGVMAKKERLQDFQNTNLHKDGHEVILETNGVPAFDEKRNLIGYRGVDRDITKRLENEQLRQQQQAEINSIFKASSAGIGLVRNRRLVRGNRRFFEITGYSEDELIDCDPQLLYLSEQDYFDVGKKYDEALDKGFSRIETRFVRKDQRLIDVVVYFSPLNKKDPDEGFVVVLQDITELKAVRKQALDEKSRAQTYLDVANVMILVLDTDGRVKLVNKKGCEILERDADQLIGVNWFKTCLPSSYQQIAWNLFERIINGNEKAVAHFENPIITMRGKEKLIAWNNTVLRDESGKIIAVISSGQDITESRAVEEEKRKSDQQLRVALSAAKMGTWRWDAATNRDTFDDSLKALLGLTEQQMAQEYQDLYVFAHPDDRQAAKAEFDRAIREHDTYLAHFRIVQPNGEIRWVLDQGKPFYDYNGKLEYFTGVVVDITERQKAEEAIKKSEQRFRAAANYTYDWESWIAHDGAIQWINPTVERMTGYSIEECLEMEDYPLPLVHEEDRELMAGIVKEALQGSSGNDQRFRIRKKDGSISWGAISWQPIFDQQGQSLGYRSSVRDITKRKAAEDALRANRDLLKRETELFENMFHTIPDALYMKDRDSRFTHINEALQRRIGLQDEQEAIGKTDFDFFTEAHAQPAYEDEQEIMRTGVPKIGYQEKETWPDGRVAWVLSTKMPLRDVHGNIIGLLGISHDITNQVESQQRYENIVDSAPIGIMTYELEADGRLMLSGTNRTANAILGVTFSLSLGKTIEDVFPNIAETSLPDEFRRICKDGGTYHRDNFEYHDSYVDGIYEIDAFQTSPGKMAVMFVDVSGRESSEQ